VLTIPRRHVEKDSVVKTRGGYTVLVQIEDGYIVARNSRGDVLRRGTDASEVIQAAINSLIYGGMVFIKKGLYILSVALTVSYSYVTIKGEGWGTILKIGDGANVNAINFASDKTHIHLKDFKIDGNKANQTATSHGIACGGNHYSTFRNLWITDVRDRCIDLGWSDWCLLSDLLLENSSYGIYVRNGADNNILQRIIAKGHANHGIYIWSYCYRNIVAECQLRDNGIHGFESDGYCYETIVEGCHCDWNGTYGISFANNSHQCIAVGNICRNNAYDGIQVENVSYECIIVGNICLDNSRYGINIRTADCERCIVSNNVTKGNVTTQINNVGVDTLLKVKAGEQY